MYGAKFMWNAFSSRTNVEQFLPFLDRLFERISREAYCDFLSVLCFEIKRARSPFFDFDASLGGYEPMLDFVEKSTQSAKEKLTKEAVESCVTDLGGGYDTGYNPFDDALKAKWEDFCNRRTSLEKKMKELFDSNVFDEI